MSLLDLDIPSGSHNEDAFIAAFDEYNDALFRHAFFRLSDRERAIELVHDTYIQAWSYVCKGVVIGSYKSFLYKILNNRIIDEYRKQKSVSLDAMIDGDESDERYMTELHDHSHETLITSIDARHALEYLQDIPPQYREAVVLRYIDGLSPKEIAELIETTENVVSLRIHRGLRALKKILETKQ